MKKNTRIEEWLSAWNTCESPSIPKELQGFVFCFNQGEYYFAHDVLEHLWLRCHDANRSFYQALIQLAGAFVHFQKHALFPEHPTHQRRLRPGIRLLGMCSARLLEYGDAHQSLDLIEIRALCSKWTRYAETCTSPLKSYNAPILYFLPA